MNVVTLRGARSAALVGVTVLSAAAILVGLSLRADPVALLQTVGASPSAGLASPAAGIPTTTAPAPSPPAPPTAEPSGSALPELVEEPGWVDALPAPDIVIANEWHIPVLTYHRITTAAEAGDSLPGLVVDPGLFDRQLAALRAAGWRTITAAELASAIARDVRPPARSFVITIDDGYADGATYALPILLAHGFRATFYVVTGRLGMTAILTTDQVRALAAAGMEVADHTVDHVSLPTLTPDEQLAEVAGGADALATILGARPTTFAYPFGAYDASTVDAVRRAGLALAFTTERGCREAPSIRFRIPRFHVGPATTPADLIALVAGCA